MSKKVKNEVNEKEQTMFQYLKSTKGLGAALYFGYKRYFMPLLYGVGAFVVLLGAMFKLTHIEFLMPANLWLMIGLGTEALIFLASAFEKPHMEPDWSRIYPQFDEDYGKVPGQSAQRREVTNTSNVSSMGQFGSMPNISDYDRETLMESIKKLSENASQMAKIADAIKATDRYTEDMNEAAESARKLTSKLQISSDLKLNETMSNYINQVKDSQDLIKNLNGQVSTLKGHMENLNNVYGGMLNAMKIK